MTTAENHPCKQTGLRNVLKILDNPENPKLYFVVPPDVFISFSYQSYIGKNGLVPKRIDANIKKISQFVLTFDFFSQ